MNFLKRIYHYFLAWFSSVIYKHPSRDIFVLGVTGTNGKTTTVEIISSILENAGKKTAFSSSARVKIADNVFSQKGSMTMPGRFFLQKFLREAVSAGCDYAILEVTSEGVRQHRHRFIDFDAALVTNISPEHIESHGSFKKYLEAKVSFFRYVAWNSRKENKLFFVNKNDENKDSFARAVGENGKVFEFSKDDFVKKLVDPGQISDWLSSDFNLENSAAAVLFSETRNVSFGDALQALSRFRGVQGRMEYAQKEPFAVVVDLALTPRALNSLYEFLNKESKKLICVFGSAGGGRDKWKRPVLGKIAEEHCDTIIITDDEPYGEDPKRIREEISAGIKNKGKVKTIPDRKEAIIEAVSIARAGDTVVVTGMGDLKIRHLEQGKKIPWSDRSVVEEALSKLVN